MGSIHRYKLIQGGDDVKDDIKDEPQRTSTPVVISWWKFLLCNLLAAGAGAAAMFLIVHALSTNPPSGNAVSHLATPTNLSTDLTRPTPSIEHAEEEIIKPNMAVGTILDCGYSPSEARAKGCVYDVMMQDWVPEPCYDGVLTEKYLAEGNWTWYGDGNGNTTISDEVMRRGEHGTAWMSSSYHKAHCVFSWIKIVRALRNNRGISQELLSYDHVLHCSHGALKENINPDEEHIIGVGAPTNYAKCALYDTWIRDLIPDKHNSTQR